MKAALLWVPCQSGWVALSLGAMMTSEPGQLPGTMSGSTTVMVCDICGLWCHKGHTDASGSRLHLVAMLVSEDCTTTGAIM